MFKPFYDPEGLQPLNVASEEKEPYSAPGKNGDVQLYAAVIEKGEKTFERLYVSAEYRHGSFHTGLCEENP